MSDETAITSATPRSSPFDAIRQEDQEGNEYWSARELAEVLGYTNWRNFRYAIDKAKIACESNGYRVGDHFDASIKMIATAKGARRPVEDFRLSRYACYLLVQNADPNKPIVALGQNYFAEQTRRMELADELAGLGSDVLAGMSEAQKRLFVRQQLAEHNIQLAAAARSAGVFAPEDYAVFQDHGYVGLYGGLRARDIHRRKRLTANQKILDFMGVDELAANLFRSTLTAQRLRRDAIEGREAANQTHQEIGGLVRQTIIDAGGTMPEDLPTPTESIQQLERREREQARRRLERGPQLSLFDLANSDDPPAND